MATTPTTLPDALVVSKLINSLVNYQTDVAERNTYIDKRDRYLYGDGLFEDILIPDGFDKTLYNFLRPITQIHATQFMQDGFGVYAKYNMDDTSIFDPQQDEEKITQMENSNKEKEIRSWAKKKMIDAIIRDNGGYKLFVDGAQTGSDYGSTLFQMFWNNKRKKVEIHLVESLQNWFPIWRDNDFRERIGDAYITQLSPVVANQLWQDKIPEGGFPTSYSGEPLTAIQGTTSTLTTSQGETVTGASTRRPMVTVFNFSGYLPNIAYDANGNFVECKDGDETMLSFQAVGNTIVDQITDERYMPRFYYIPNQTVPRRPYGESDLPESALQINTTMVQVKSDQITRANKVLFPIIQAIGFENGTIPPRNQREMTIVPMQQGQQFLPVPFDTQAIEYDRLQNQLMADLLQMVRIPRVLFDDPTVTLNSNQALLTSMRPILDVVSKKQKNWEPVITRMFNDALALAALHEKDIADILNQEDDDSYLYVRWPSSLRKDDPAHQAMLINDLHSGAISIDTYMELRGTQDVEEEINRIANAMKDPVRAAIMGGQLGALAHFAILKGEGLPAWGLNPPKVTLRGDLPPQEVGNLAHQQGWDQGPWGAAIGPTGAAGTAANDNFMNQGLIKGNAYDGGTPTTAPGAPPTGPSAPIVTPDQNNPAAQPMSMPGSGAPAVSPQTAVSQTMQRRGRR